MNMQTHLVVHLYFFPTQKPTQKNAKELPSERTKDTVNNGQTDHERQKVTVPKKNGGRSANTNICVTNKVLWWQTVLWLNSHFRVAANRLPAIINDNYDT